MQIVIFIILYLNSLIKFLSGRIADYGCGVRNVMILYSSWDHSIKDVEILSRYSTYIPQYDWTLGSVLACQKIETL